MQDKTLIRITVLGAESTGKTTLSHQLAEHFNTVWVPEYAREYVENLSRPYNAEDILTIAREHFRQEQKMLDEANRFIFIDTGFIISKVWCEEKFGFCHPWINEMIQKHPYDLYLLTSNDLPWLTDPVRENPHLREFLFDRYKKELEENNLNYAIVSGTGEVRFQNALKIINENFRT